MVKHYDRARKELPVYGVGHLLMVNGKHIKRRRAVKKLVAKLFGPFKVKKLVVPEGQSVELELPLHRRVHNVFHTSLVEPYCTSGHRLCNEPIAVTDSEDVN